MPCPSGATMARPLNCPATIRMETYERPRGPPGPRGLPPPPDGRSPPGRSPPERGPAERGAKGRPPGLRGRACRRRADGRRRRRGLEVALGPVALGAGRAVLTRLEVAAGTLAVRPLFARLERALGPVAAGAAERGLALAQPSFLAGRFSASSTAASAARVRLGLRDGSDMGEPDLPRTTDPVGRRPGTGAGVSTVLPWGRFSGRMCWASISRITRGPTSSTSPVVQRAQLERAVGQTDQPVHRQAEGLQHLADLAVLALGDGDADPQIGGRPAVDVGGLLLGLVQGRLDRAVADRRRR